MPKEFERLTHRWFLLVSVVSIVVIPLLVVGVVVWSVLTHQDLIAAIGLALSVVVAYVATIRPFLEKPRLTLFRDSVRCSPPTLQNDTASWFVRLGIVNYGLRPAKDCVGRVFEVWTAQGEQLMKFDPLTLFWARQDNNHTGFSPVAIQGGGDFEYLDIAQVKMKDTTPLELRVVIPPPMTLTKWPDNYPSPGIDPVLKGGTYYLRIGVHAADAVIKPSWFEITCSEAVPACDEQPPCQIQKKAPQFVRR
jgi:hypothetical protein